MTASRSIDHLVLAVHDLEAAARFYQRLGFQVGARNKHPWGTENRLIQFESSFLELIAVGREAHIPAHSEGLFSFGAFVADYLRQRQGLAMFVLGSVDAVADAARFAEARIGEFEPFTFERAGRRPDGSETRVAFTLAFACDESLPLASFFTCQQRYPESFWNAELQRHPNGVTGISSVTLEVADGVGHSSFLRTFTGASDDGGAEFRLAHGEVLRVRTGGHQGFAGFSVVVPDLVQTVKCLTDNQVAFTPTAGGLVVSAGLAFGADIGFVSVQDG